VCTLAVAVLVVWSVWSSKDANALAIGNFVALALTLIVLVWYAYDTNSIARVTRERWLREGVLSTTYAMQLTGEKGQAGRTLFQLHNPSTLIVRAKVACNFRLYGEPIKAGPAYDGKDVWLLFPQQVSQGWFEIDPLLQTKGKSVDAMIAERTPANSKDQLTMLLELEFWDELGMRRKLPARPHYFDFDRWAWIPQLTEGQESYGGAPLNANVGRTTVHGTGEGLMVEKLFQSLIWPAAAGNVAWAFFTTLLEARWSQGNFWAKLVGLLSVSVYLAADYVNTGSMRDKATPQYWWIADACLAVAIVVFAIATSLMNLAWAKWALALAFIVAIFGSALGAWETTETVKKKWCNRLFLVGINALGLIILIAGDLFFPEFSIWFPPFAITLTVVLYLGGCVLSPQTLGSGVSK
jgi:hypothetical protein